MLPQPSFCTAKIKTDLPTEGPEIVDRHATVQHFADRPEIGRARAAATMYEDRARRAGHHRLEVPDVALAQR